MPSKKSTLEFGVKFTTDQASVNAVKKSLQDIQNIKFKDFNGPNELLRKIIDTAAAVEQALTKAFNVNLGTLNTKQFNQELKQTVGSVDKVYTLFSKLGAQGKVAFSQMASSVLTTNLQLKLTSSLISSMGLTMANTIKWGIASSVMNSFTNSVKSAFDYVKGLDAALTDIRIVTGDSTEQMRQFAELANRTAQTLGRSTMDYTKAALTFYQQGLDEQSVQARTQSVLTAQNITGAGDLMADYLTAVWNGYKVANEEAELYVDKLAAVADSSASNMSLLAIAMSKVASTANMLGVPVDSLNAQIATIVATTRQAPETVGNALKTIYARINDITTGADDAEVSLGNYTKQMAALGVSVLDSNGKLRDTGDVIELIGGKWETLSREQQIYLARTMAGQRQYNNLLALFENWSKYSDLVTVSMDAQGAAAEKNSRYMESLSAKLEQFGAAGERVKTSLIDELSLKKIVEFGTNAVNVFGSLIQSIGGGSGALLNFGSIFASLFSNTITKLINNVVTNIQNARNNIDILKADIEETKNFGFSQGYTVKDSTGKGAIELMVLAKKAAQLYYDYMDLAQINHYNNIVKEIGAAKDQVLILTEQKEEAEKFLNVFQDAKHLPRGTLLLNIQAQAYQAKEALKDVSISYESILNNQSKDYYQNTFTELKNTVKELQEAAGGSSVLKSTGEAWNNYVNAIKKVKELSGLTAPKLLALRNRIRLLQQATGVKLDSILGLDKTNQALTVANSRLQLAQKSATDYLNAVKQFANVKTYVDMATSLARVASGINNIVNLTKVWRNLNLSTGLKVLQTFTNLGMTIPMLVTGVSKLLSSLGITQAIQANINKQKALEEIRNAILLKQADVDIAKGKEKVKLQAELNALKGKLAILNNTPDASWSAGLKNLGGNLLNFIKTAGPFIAAAAAIGVAIYAMYKAWNADAEAAKSAAEGAQQAKEAYLQTKQALDDLKSSLDSLNESYSTINLLTIGTQEWRNAVREVNDEVLELIKNYPILADYVENVNGMLRLSPEGQLEAIRLQTEAVEASQQASIAAAQKARDANITSQATDLVRATGTNSYTIEDRTFRGLNSKDAIEIVKSLDEAKILLALSKKLSEDSANYNKELAAILQKQTGYDQQLIESLISDTSGLEALRQAIIENTTATKLLSETIAAQALQNQDWYKGLSDIDQTVANAVGGALYDEALEAALKKWYDTLVKDITRVSDAQNQDWSEEVLEAVSKATNQNLVWDSNSIRGGGKTGREFYFNNQDEGGKEVHYNQEYVVSVMAAKTAMLEFGASALQATGVLQALSLSGLDSELQNAIKNLIAGNGAELSQGQVIDLKGFNLSDIFSDLQILIVAAAMGTTAEKVETEFDNVIDSLDRRFIEVLDLIPLSFRSNIQELFNGKDLNLDTLLLIANQFKLALLTGGKQGYDLLLDFYKSIEDLDAFNELTNQIDFSNITAEEFANKLEQAGILTLLTNLQLKAYIDLKRQLALVLSPELQYKNIHDIINGLETGDIIDAEQAKKLESAGVNLDKYFTRMADGSFKLVEDALKFYDLVNDLSFLPFKQKMQLAINQNISLSNLNENFDNFDDLSQSALTGNRNSLGTQTYNNELLKQQLLFLDAIKTLNLLIIDIQNRYEEGLSLSVGDIQKVSLAVEEQKGKWEEIPEIIQQNNQLVQQYQEELANSAQSIQELNLLYSTGLISNQTYLDAYSRLDLAEMLGDLDPELIDTFGDYLQDAAKDVLDLNDLLEENALAADIVAQSIMKMNDGVEALSENFEEWRDVLLNSSEASLLYYNALEGTREAIATLLDISKDYVSDDYITSHLEEISAAALGDALAIDLLRNHLADDIIARIAVENDLDNVDLLSNLVNQIQAEIPDIKVGTEINLDGMDSSYSGFVDMCNELIKSAGLTVDQANKLFDSLGFEAKFKTEKQPVLTTGYSTVHAVKLLDYVPIKTVSEDGTAISVTGVPAYLEYTYPGTPYTYTNYVDAFAMTGDGSEPVIESITKKATGIFNNSSGRNIGANTSKNTGSNKSSSPKKSSSSVPKAPERKETITLRSDPYHDINIELLLQERKIKKLLEAESHLTDLQRLEHIQKQNELLENQLELLRKKLIIAERLRNRIADELQGSGIDIKFNEDGTIANYNEALNNALNNYNAAIGARNTNVENAYQRLLLNEITKDQYDEIVKAADETLKKLKEKYDAIKNNIKEYDETLNKINEINENIEEAIEKEIDKRIEASQIKVNVAIDSGLLEREWLDFENKFIKKLDKDDFLGNAKASAKELMSYFDSEQVQQVNKLIARVRLAIATIQAGGSDSIYGTRLEEAQERLSELLKNQQGQLKNIQDQVDNLKEAYLDALDSAKDKMDDQIDQYERINDLIDHNVKLTLLLYGDKAYDTMNKYYDMQKDNNEQVLQTLRMQQIYWQNQMNNEEIGSDAWKKMKKIVDDITDQLNSNLEDMIENLSDQWLNRVNQIIDKLNNALTGGRGLDYLDEQWDYINDFDDSFLDPIESRMGINEITSLYQLAIDGLTGSPRQQEKINKLMNDQLKLLREKDNLTQYDLDRAKASLEVEKARLALEEARDNKTKMRLRRDSQGNYTYQYVADEEKLSDLQQSLADAEAKLYNMDKEQYKQNLNDFYDAFKEYSEKIHKLQEEKAHADDEEAQRIQLRIDLYEKLFEKIEEAYRKDNNVILNDYLLNSAFQASGYNREDYTEEEQMLLLRQWTPQVNSGIQDTINEVGKLGGTFNAIILPLREQLALINKEYEENITNTLNMAGTSLDTIANVTDAAGNALDTNIQKATNLISTYQDFANTTIESFESLRDFIEKYNENLDLLGIQEYVDQAREAYNLLQELKNAPEATYAENLNVVDRKLDTTEPGSGIPNAENKNLLQSDYEAKIKEIDLILNNSNINNTDQLTFTNIMSSVLGAIQNMNSVANQQMASLTGAADGYIGTIGNVEHLDQNVHIEANFPNVQGAREIEEAFNNLVNMASMYASKYRD